MSFPSRVTRDITFARIVRKDGKASIARTPIRAGTVVTHASASSRDAFVAKVNAQHPGAAEALT